MKYPFLVWIGLMIILQGRSQTPYPLAPAVPTNINQVEYFFNTDPGFGNGINLPVTAQQNINAQSASLNISSAPNGFSQFFLRSRNANGQWSHTAQFTLVKFDTPIYPVASSGAPNVVRAEYFIGNDPGFGNGVATTLVAQPNITDQAVLLNLSALPQGFYQVGVRTLDANGRWSLTHFRDFAKVDVAPYPVAPAAVSNIVAAEYFINTDPGLGLANPLNIGNATNLPNINAIIDLSGLPPAINTLGIRTRNANGLWSLSHMSVFTNNTPAPYPTAPAPATALQRLEYFIDTDPGFGNGISIPFASGVDVQNLNVSIDLSSIPDGEHTLFIRSRNNPYSLTNMVTFLKGQALPLSWLYVRGELKADGAHIGWGTASEVNTKHFLVEHSSNGIDFTAIQTQAAAGNSQTAKHYSFVHSNPAQGMNYYRIKQVDKDGSFSYSKTVALLNRSNLNSVVLAPNPVVNQLMLVLPKPAAKAAQLRISNASGQVLLQQTMAQGTSQFIMEVSRLAAGKYQLQIIEGTTTETFSFLKL